MRCSRRRGSNPSEREAVSPSSDRSEGSLDRHDHS